MKQFFTTRETLDLLGLESPHELVPLIQAGLEPLDSYGRPFPESKRPSGPGEPYSTEEIEDMAKARFEAMVKSHQRIAEQGIIDVRDSTPPYRSNVHDEQYWRQARREVEKLPFFPRKNERSWKHLKLPDPVDVAEKLIAEMMGWKFLAADVTRRAERVRPVLLLGLDEVLRLPGIKPHSLFQLLKSGALTPLSNTGKPIPCPTFYHEYMQVYSNKSKLGHEEWNRELAKWVELDPGLNHENGSWRYLHIPETTDAQEDLLKILRENQTHFAREEVEWITKPSSHFAGQEVRTGSTSLGVADHSQDSKRRPEFWARKDLPPDIARNDYELWELVIRSGRLIPFAKTETNPFASIDPVSGDRGYRPLLPYPFDEHYSRFRALPGKIETLAGSLELFPTQQAWGEYFNCQKQRLQEIAAESILRDLDKTRDEAIQELAKLRAELEQLQAEFEDIPRLLRTWDYTDGQHKLYLKELNDKAFFRSDQVAEVRNSVQSSQAEAANGTGENGTLALEKASQNVGSVCDEPPGNTIKQLRKGYLVTFQGTDIVLSDKMAGSRYIYHLITVYAEDTDRELLSAMELENLVMGTAPIEPTSYDLGAALDDGLNVAKQFSEDDLDTKGKEELHDQMDSLKADLAEAERACDSGQVEKIQLEIHKLRDWALREYAYDSEKGAMLKRSTGSISNSDHEKKAENRVRRNVNTLLGNLASEHETKAFVQHMRDSIKFGKQPHYAPSTPINWTVE